MIILISVFCIYFTENTDGFTQFSLLLDKLNNHCWAIKTLAETIAYNEKSGTVLRNYITQVSKF